MKRIIFSSLLTVLINISYSQSTPYPEVTIASPTAAALGKYGDIPVSYHTGVPEISIPLYIVREGPLSLPISLSYHSGGIKLMEPASWVGLGWSLNAGGMITRTVQGAPDEKGTINTPTQSYGHFSNYGFNNYLYQNQNGDAPQTTIQDWQNYANGSKDGVPDLFFFNFNGYSGKFYFRDDRTPVIVPQQDFKIDYAYTDGYGIQSFTITTRDGVKYTFGNSGGITGDAPIEITNPWTIASGSTPSTLVSSWFLNKIQSADGKFAITLQYTKENYGYFTIGTRQVDPTRNYQTDPGFYLSKNIMQGVRVSKIVFSNGEVDFDATTVRTDLSDNGLFWTESVNTDAKELDEIQIIDNGGSFCKKFKFSYSYFNDANNTSLPYFTGLENISTDKKRLRLDSVKEKTCDGVITLPPYIFTYYTTVNLPRRLCFAQDYWGFNNGQTTNMTLFPTISVFDGSNTRTYGGANREPAWPDMRAGNLEKITYPTGGFDQFDFEPNDVHESSSTSQYQSSASLVVHPPGQGQESYFITKTITVTDASHPLVITANNTAGNGWAATFKIKDNSTGNFISPYNIDNDIPDGTNGNLNSLYLSPGSYDCSLSLSTSASGMCQVYLSYNWGTTSISQNAFVGGIRIKTLTGNAGTNNANVITNYSYNYTNGQSAGVLYDIPTFVQAVRNDLIKNVGYWTVNGYQQYSLSPNGCVSAPSPTYYISAGNLRPLSTVQGSHIGYKQVTVSQSGNGSSIYTYYVSNYSYLNQQISPLLAVTYADLSYCNTNIPNYPASPLAFDFKRGELNSEDHYDNTGFRLKNITYVPQYDTMSVAATPVFVVVSRNSAWGTQFLGTFDSIRTVRKTQVQTIETDYPKTGGSITIQKTKYFAGKYHNEVTKEESTNSKSENIQTIYKYAFDFRITNCDNINCLNTYNTAYSNCNTTYNTSKANCPYNDAPCLTTAYVTYQQCLNMARINYVSCTKTNFTNISNSYNTCHTDAKSTANSDLKPILEMQDEYINEPIETSTWKNNTLLTAQFNKDTIDASGNVYIKRVQKINLAAPATSLTNATVNGSGLTKDNRYQDETAINFNLGNIQDVTDKTGITKLYLWDYKNRLPVALINGNQKSIAANNIAYTSFEADGTGNWTIPSTLRTSTAITGNQGYNLSNGAISKSFPSGTYKLTLWATATPTISGNPTPVTGRIYNGFTYYEYNVTTSSVTISGSTTIDELRLYPADAQMTTYTYAPLIGMTSQCDVNNRITYYQYDGLGRLTLIKDQDGNIVKKYQYAYQSPNPAGASDCTSSNCKGVDEQCINGFCQKAKRVNTSTNYVTTGVHAGQWKCNYYYVWNVDENTNVYKPPDATPGGGSRLTEYNSFPCDVNQ